MSETQSGNYQTSFRIPASGSGTSGKYSLDNMFTNTGGTFTGTPDINTTYYLWDPVNVDVSDTTATASDVLTGKYFYTSNGTKTEGSLGVEVESKDVDFYDYDGTRLYSYTKQEFLALNEMPANPTHAGLTSQGWNWSLADAKEQVADFNQLNIGQMYVTDDNKTRLYIHLENVRLKPYLSFCVNGSVLVEWGDGTSETITGTSTSTLLSTPHTYSQGGDYVIKLSSNSTIYFNIGGNDNMLHGNGIANSYYVCSLTKIELGGNVELNRYAFHGCQALKSITMPNTITALHSEFYGCVSLLFVVIPINVAFSNGALFQNISGLTTYSFPKGIVLSGNPFQNCSTMQKLIIPPRTTSISSQMCRFCYALAEVVFAKGTNEVNTYAFQNCTSAKLYDFRKVTSVPTLVNINAFAQIPTDCKIVVPDSLYATWITATNWSNYASHIVKESEYVG